MFESMSVNRNESDAIFQRESNVSEVRGVERIDHESIGECALKSRNL